MKNIVFGLIALFLLFSCASTPKVDETAYSLLYTAVINSDYPSVNQVLVGTDKQVISRIINKQDKQGSTLLIVAVKNAQLNIVKALLNSGADKLPKDKKGKTAEDYAWEIKAADILALLQGKGSVTQVALGNAAVELNTRMTDAQKKFVEALESNNIDAVREWLSTGKVDMYQDVPAQGSRPPLPILLYAIDTNRSQSIIAEIINYYNSSLDDITDRDGKHAWYYATLRNNATVQRLLREKGINEKAASNTQW
ncbi:MAG: ankyrin repeat domain-containing protein [Prevotella sp.]|jgi:ankyrin repeat protein|nr:ankyrin repeat domain-containing protein [Prevotella sp.]